MSRDLQQLIDSSVKRSGAVQINLNSGVSGFVWNHRSIAHVWTPSSCYCVFRWEKLACFMKHDWYQTATKECSLPLRTLSLVNRGTHNPELSPHHIIIRNKAWQIICHECPTVFISQSSIYMQLECLWNRDTHCNRLRFTSFKDPDVLGSSAKNAPHVSMDKNLADLDWIPHGKWCLRTHTISEADDPW